MTRSAVDQALEAKQSELQDDLDTALATRA